MSPARRAHLLLLLIAACGAPEPEPARTLSPDPNPMRADDPLGTPQPHRERPRALCLSPDGRRAWVMLGGTEDAPGEAVAVVDLEAKRLERTIPVGRSPWGCALDPSGRWLVVTLRYTDRAVVLDTSSEAVAAEVPVPYYTESAIWSPAGDRVYLANRWKDSVLRWDVSTSPSFAVSRTSYESKPLHGPLGVAVADNPGPLAISADGRRLYVGTVAGGALSIIDTEAEVELKRLHLSSPVGGLATWGPYLYLSDVGRGGGAEAHQGRDLDGDGQPGDGTANVVFQDLQNELAVIDTRTLAEVHRYTSDTLCCRDFRDVDPERPERGLELPAPDTWSPDVLAALAPASTWIVAGALPEALVQDGGVLWVAYSGSNEVQSFTLREDGSLVARERAGGLFRTGFNPKAMAAAGGRVVTVDRLGESLSLLPADPAAPAETIVVGDVSQGPFPSTDSELGEAVNEMTAIFAVDGDQTCVHCHRDNGAIDRPVVMPLQVDRRWGARNVMAQRGLYDTRPWFFESAMEENNFFPVLNEFARRENFCCEGQDPTVWRGYPSAEACARDGSLTGCNHVLRCEDDPPPECATRPYGSPTLRRAAFYRDAARHLFGRDTTFGDAIYREDPGGARRPIPLDFEGVTRVLGLFMLRTPRLLPNPNRALELPAAARGRAIFEQATTACGSCHPLPLGTTSSRPEPFSPAGMPVRFPPVVSPSRGPGNSDASRVTDGFRQTFPLTVQTAAGLHLGATPLRGLWDRPRTRFLHDGRAGSLLETLATPGHPALGPGQVGRNERDGVLDTHGGTSQLDRWELEDLITFLESL